MKKFRKILAVVITIMLMVAVSACGSDSPDQNTPNPTQNTITEATTQEKENENTTEPTTTAPDPDYVITVVDENGNPISGVLLQMCLETCVPGKTNEDGVAEFYLDEADYKVSLLNMPYGFDYSTDETEWYFGSGEKTMTIVLKTIG
jgi:hypothetical protein